MATISAHFFHYSHQFPLPCPPSVPRPFPARIRISSSQISAKFMEFPRASGPHGDLIEELLSSVENRVGSSLQPCTLRPEIQDFGNPDGTAHGSLQIRSGLPSSQIDFMVGSCINCALPSGGTLDISSLSAYLRPSTDAPHFFMDLIQNSPTSLVLILDLTPRKDLITHPDYLKTYYEDSQLDKHRQRLLALPEVKPYFSPSLYVRSLLSPTAILVSVDSGTGGSSRIEGIVRDHIIPIGREVLEFWLDNCASVERNVAELEKVRLAQRDGMMKNKTLEVDLELSFPRMFGQEVATQVLDVLKGYYNA